MASAACKNKRMETKTVTEVDTGGIRMNLTDAEAKWLRDQLPNVPSCDENDSIFWALEMAIST